MFKERTFQKHAAFIFEPRKKRGRGWCRWLNMSSGAHRMRIKTQVPDSKEQHLRALNRVWGAVETGQSGPWLSEGGGLQGDVRHVTHTVHTAPGCREGPPSGKAPFVFFFLLDNDSRLAPNSICALGHIIQACQHPRSWERDWPPRTRGRVEATIPSKGCKVQGIWGSYWSIINSGFNASHWTLLRISVFIKSSKFKDKLLPK